MPIQTFAFTGGVVHNTIHKPVKEFKADRIIVKMKDDSKPFRVVTLAHNETVENAIATYKKQNTVLYAEPDYIASIDATSRHSNGILTTQQTAEST